MLLDAILELVWMNAGSKEIGVIILVADGRIVVTRGKAAWSGPYIRPSPLPSIRASVSSMSRSMGSRLGKVMPS